MAKSRRSSSRRGSRRSSRSRNSRNSRSCGSGRCWSRRQNGGQAPIDDMSMSGPTKLSLAQGTDYARLHNGQHGGAAVSLVNAAPPGYTGVMDDPALVTASRTGPLNDAMAAATAAGQAGGRRRGSMRKSRRGSMRKSSSRKSRRSSMRKSRMMYGGKRRGKKNTLYGKFRKMLGLNNSRKGRKGRKGGKKSSMLKKLRKMLGMKGGAYSLSSAADYGAPGMLLSPADQAKALGGMNPEWKLATDPASFNPK